MHRRHLPGLHVKRPGAATILAAAALMISLGGNAAAALIITGNSQVAQGTISGHNPPTGKHPNIITGSVDGQDLADDAVGNADIAPDAVHGPQVADNSLTGADIKESTLSEVPSASKANDAFSAFHDGSLAFPDTLNSVYNPIASLNVSHAGSYVINALLEASQGEGSPYADDVNAKCVLTAGGDFDTKLFTVLHGKEVITDSSSYVIPYDVVVSLQVMHTFNDAGNVTLSCTDFANAYSSSVFAHYTKITAIQVNNLYNYGF
jgi:hypothetical protein